MSVPRRGRRGCARSACCVISVIALAAAPAGTLGAQVPESATLERGAAVLDSLLRAGSSHLSMAKGRLEGPGAVLLLAAAKGAQFVAVGEQHDVREIPLFVRLLFAALQQRERFAYLATENGSITVEAMLAARAAPVFAKRYPAALEFDSDQDLELYDSVAARLHHAPRSIWGVDQEFGALYLLDRLRALNATGQARRALDSLRAIVLVAEAERFDRGGQHWLAVGSRPEMFQRLRAIIAPRAGSESDRILQALETSSRLYDYNVRADRGELTGFASNNEREEYMKRQFVAQYREAMRRDGQTPKALVRMGSAHLARGQSPYGPFALGNLLAELATINGRGFVNVLVLAHNPPADSSTAPNIWDWPDMRPLANAASPTEITLIDLRPIRPWLYARRLGNVGPDLRRNIYGYDFALLIGNASKATEGGTTP